MKPTWIVACLTLVGCSQIFGLEVPSRGIDAAMEDAFVEIDAPDAGFCLGASKTCAGTNVLRTCMAGSSPTDTTCAWGCDSSTVDASCKMMTPSGGVLFPADLVTTATLVNVVIDTATTINTDTGAITGVRAAGSGVVSGIKYEQRSGGGVFTMQELTLSTSLVAIGARPLVIVAVDGATISSGGTLDLRGTCATNVGGPGGGPGGQQASNAPLQGGQGGGTPDEGGGGGGFGGVGGRGGDGSSAQGPGGGTTKGVPNIPTLFGGTGGGGGGDDVGGGTGGGGGGAVQIVTNGDVVVSSSGAINAGGCGGKPGNSADSGGGGGAGGAILLEAVTITIHGTLAVNGGGGGADDSGTPGENGSASRTRAAGGNAHGGAGAAGSFLAGADGTDANTSAGGGGGGIGRIRLNTRGGSVIVGNSGVMSPSFTDANTTATQGTAAIQ